MRRRAVGFWESAGHQPDHPAVVDASGAVVSFAELRQRADRVANGLIALGLRRGDCVALLLSNVVAYFEIYFAATQIGLYVTPLNVHLKADEIAYILSDCEARALFADVEHASTAVSAAHAVGLQPSHLLAVGGEAPGVCTYEGWKGDQSPLVPACRSAGLAMMYTSGTTGRPKGVRRRLSERTPDEVGGSTAAFAAMFDIRPWDNVYLSAGPLYHSAPLNFSTSALQMGHTVVMMGRWTPEETLDLVERHRVTYTHMVPTMFHRLLALPAERRASFDSSSLRQVLHAAAPCSVATKRAMIDWWGPIIWEYYAATEIGGTIVSPEEWLARPGTVGRPWPGAQIEVLDDEGRRLPPGRTGTIYMSNASSGDFEYYKDAAKTSVARRGNMTTVGDMGYIDEEGWLFISDRKADMIISGGVNIYPAEIEAALSDHSKVADVAVIGVPNSEWGEEVKAIVQPCAGVEGDEALAVELISYLRDRIANYKVPRSVEFRVELPRHTTGKLLKRELRDEYWAERRV